jgi:hypothetical protein
MLHKKNGIPIKTGIPEMMHNIHLQIDSFPLLSSFLLRYSRTRAHSLPGSDMPTKPPYRLSHGAAVFVL